MALTTQTMTDEQRKSVAIEYLKAFDNGGTTSSGGSILDLFAEDERSTFRSGAWPMARSRLGSCSVMSAARSSQSCIISRSSTGFSPALICWRARARAMENTSMASGEPEAPISAPGVGVTCLRFATGNPTGVHLPRSRLRRQGHHPIPLAHRRLMSWSVPSRFTASRASSGGATKSASGRTTLGDPPPTLHGPRRGGPTSVRTDPRPAQNHPTTEAADASLSRSERTTPPDRADERAAHVHWRDDPAGSCGSQRPAVHVRRARRHHSVRSGGVG